MIETKGKTLQERITSDMRVKGFILVVAMGFVGWIIYLGTNGDYKPDPFVVSILSVIFYHHYRRAPKGSDVNDTNNKG